MYDPFSGEHNEEVDHKFTAAQLAEHVRNFRISTPGAPLAEPVFKLLPEMTWADFAQDKSAAAAAAVSSNGAATAAAAAAAVRPAGSDKTLMLERIFGTLDQQLPMDCDAIDDHLLEKVTILLGPPLLALRRQYNQAFNLLFWKSVEVYHQVNAYESVEKGVRAFLIYHSYHWALSSAEKEKILPLQVSVQNHKKMKQAAAKDSEQNGADKKDVKKDNKEQAEIAAKEADIERFRAAKLAYKALQVPFLSSEGAEVCTALQDCVQLVGVDVASRQLLFALIREGYGAKRQLPIDERLQLQAILRMQLQTNAIPAVVGQNMLAKVEALLTEHDNDIAHLYYFIYVELIRLKNQYHHYLQHHHELLERYKVEEQKAINAFKTSVQNWVAKDADHHTVFDALKIPYELAAADGKQTALSLDQKALTLSNFLLESQIGETVLADIEGKIRSQQPLMKVLIKNHADLQVGNDDSFKDRRVKKAEQWLAMIHLFISRGFASPYKIDSNDEKVLVDVKQQPVRLDRLTLTPHILKLMLGNMTARSFSLGCFQLHLLQSCQTANSWTPCWNTGRVQEQLRVTLNLAHQLSVLCAGRGMDGEGLKKLVGTAHHQYSQSAFKKSDFFEKLMMLVAMFEKDEAIELFSVAGTKNKASLALVEGGDAIVAAADASVNMSVESNSSQSSSHGSAAGSGSGSAGVSLIKVGDISVSSGVDSKSGSSLDFDLTPLQSPSLHRAASDSNLATMWGGAARRNRSASEPDLTAAVRVGAARSRAESDLKLDGGAAAAASANDGVSPSNAYNPARLMPPSRVSSVNSLESAAAEEGAEAAAEIMVSPTNLTDVAL